MKTTAIASPAGLLVRLAAVLTVSAGVWGCTTSRSSIQLPDETYGHRFEERHGGRVTLALTPADPSVEYFYYPVVVESLHVRHAPLDPARAADAQEVPVEILIKGVLPDDCSEPHDLTQWRAGHILHLTFDMRRPVGAVCNRVSRPFRLYAPLEGLYEPGDYIIKMNDEVYAFVVRSPAEAGT